VSYHRADLATPDGTLDCHVFEPSGTGPWPGVVLYMDAFGIRPDLDVMGERLASNGFVVAIPNLYYRSGPFARFDPQAVIVEGPERDRFMAMIRSINGEMVMRDTAAVLQYLDGLPSVRHGAVGAVGYCMGGGYALRAAGTFPAQVTAAASFHGGSLATDRPDSPHLLAPQMRARLYIGVAEIDPGFSAEQRQRLETALSAAGVPFTLEVYPGAQHGFAVHNHRVYNREASEQHWRRLLALLDTALVNRAAGRPV